MNVQGLEIETVMAITNKHLSSLFIHPNMMTSTGYRLSDDSLCFTIRFLNSNKNTVFARSMRWRFSSNLNIKEKAQIIWRYVEEKMTK